MIQKILNVSNVGKFRRHAAVGDQTFRKLTVIYGDNAIGKTTMAAILDSLREKSPGIIMGRRSLGSRETPTVQVLTTDGIRSFKDGEWDNPFPDLEVFYSDFVSRVVYSGDHVSNDHQKELCSLLIGRTAVNEGHRLEKMTEEHRQVQARLREAQAAIKQHVVGAMEVSDFVLLPMKDDVNRLLAEAERKLEAATNLAALTSKPLPIRTTVREPDTALLRDVLARTIECISAAALNQVAAHKADRLGGGGETWLREGMAHASSECPFCGLSLSESGLFTALQQYFSKEYEEYNRLLRHDIEALLAQFDSTGLERLVEGLERQRAVALGWDARVSRIDSERLSAALPPSVTKAVAALKEVCAALKQKQSDPLRAVDASTLDAPLEVVRAGFEAFAIADAEVGAALREIEAFVKAARDSKPDVLKEEIRVLRNQKARHEPEVAKLCSEYSQLIADKERITAHGREARANMNRSMEALLVKYRDDMNEYLEHFESAIRIANPRTNHQTKPPSVDYSISIDGVSFPLGKPLALKDAPCFGNTLSDGEKNLFALSLFMAHVKNRSDLDKVVVVVDDPVNSLDQERRLIIADTLLSMLDGLGQVVVLTHEPRLAHMLYRSAPEGDCKMLCIKREGESSCLRDWDSMDRDLATDYFRNYFTIADFLNGEPIPWEAAARCLRPFLEDYLRQRFPNAFGVEEWLGVMADRIDSAAPESPLGQMKPHLANIRLIARATNPRHHGSTHSTSSEVLNATSTELYAKKALQLVH